MIINSHVYLKSDAFIKDEDEEEVDTKKDHISSCNSSDSFHAFTYIPSAAPHMRLMMIIVVARKKKLYK